MKRLSLVFLVLCCCGLLTQSAAAKSYSVSKKRSWSGLLIAPVKAKDDPDGKVVQTLSPETNWQHDHAVFLITASKLDKKGVRWMRLKLPTRPNNSQAWVPEDYLQTKKNPWRVEISLKKHLVKVFKNGKTTRSFRAVIGKKGTPTPKGLTAIWEKAPQPNKKGFLGPWALHLTMHSNVLKNYGGGKGRVAIHGRSGASLNDPLGTSKSHGCVRVNNRDIVYLAKYAQPGTPVIIK